MVQLTTRERVDAFWSQTLGVDSAALHSPGVHAQPNPPDRANWRGIYVLALGKAVNIFAPTDLLSTIEERARNYDVDDALDPDVWVSELGEVRSVLFGPSVHHYRDSPEGLSLFAAGRRINPRDSRALAALRAEIPHDEWSAAGFAGQPGLLFGLFDEDERMVAAANLTPGPDSATDIGVVVHPDARGLGHEMRLAATAALQALAIHGIARLRALAEDPTMCAVAQTLGFTEYGRNLVIYFG
jgi:hypothetical protein